MKALGSSFCGGRVSVFAVLLWTVAGSPGVASADPNKAAGSKNATPTAKSTSTKSAAPATRLIEVEEPAEYHGIRLAPGGVVTIALKSPVIELEYPKGWSVTVTPTADGARLTAPKSIRADKIRGLVVFATRRYTLHGVIDPGSKSDHLLRDSQGNALPQADHTVVVTHKSQMDVIREAVAAQVKVILLQTREKEAEARRILLKKHEAEKKAIRKEYEEKLAEKDETIAEKDETIERLKAGKVRHGETAVARAIHKGHESRPVVLGDCQNPGVFICGLRWGTTGDNGLLRVLIDNSSPQEIEISRVTVRDELGLEDRSGGLFIEGQQTMHDGTMTVSIPPLTRVEGSLIVHDPGSVGNKLQVIVESPTRVVHAAQWIDLQRPAEPEREKALGINGTLGVIWLKDGLGGERSESAEMRGFGLWALYAVSERWHLAFDVMGARIDDVRFTDTTFNGAQGVLTRNATLLRVQGSALMRLATEGVMPFVRLGVGAQGTDYTEEFSAGEAPDSSIDADFIFTAGGGVQIRIFDSFIAGATAGVVAELGGASRHLQGGLHVGYSWQPSE